MKLLFKFIIDGKQRSLCSLDTGKIISTGHDECITVTYDSTEENLKSNQEEADTKVILHAMNAIRSGGDVVIRSPSGDTDIKVYLDYSNGKCRKQMYLGAVGIKDEEKKALVGFIPLLGMITLQPSLLRAKNTVGQQWRVMAVS